MEFSIVSIVQIVEWRGGLLACAVVKLLFLYSLYVRTVPGRHALPLELVLPELLRMLQPLDALDL